jgi:hypothetical protein
MLTALSHQFRRQVSLISEMKSTCPKVSDFRWISMASVTTWLVSNRARVLKRLDAQKPLCTPDIVWWVFLHALQAFARESKAAFISASFEPLSQSSVPASTSWSKLIVEWWVYKDHYHLRRYVILKVAGRSSLLTRVSDLPLRGWGSG